MLTHSTAGGDISTGDRRASAERGAPRRGALALAGLCTAVLLAATLEVVLDAALGHSPLTPGSPGIAGWLQGIGERLGYRVFLIALLSFTGAYAVLLALAGRSTRSVLSARWAIALVAALNAIVFAGPILFSTDVFSYIAYARMGVVHGIDPYLHGPIAIDGDPISKYVGNDWRKVATAYGPLYTLLSYPLGLLGLKGAVWAAKAMALAASAGTLALTWRCARVRGYDPATALVAVGANPLYVLYGLGGAHNDLIMTFFVMAAVSLAFAGRDAPAGAAVVAGALVKATGAVLLPFMLLSRRKASALWGAAGALVAVAAVSYPVFGLHGLDVVSALNRDAALVSTDSFPTEIAHLLGKPGVFPVDHDLLKVALVAIVVHLLWRTWRGYDWVAASGWSLLAIAVTSTWLLAWYTLWTLPLAAIARDRRLLIATLAVQGLFIVHQTAPLFSPVS
ncbi:MAG: glycosyltransferase 87 family protein [Solirubrobacteraceae bacterium]